MRRPAKWIALLVTCSLVMGCAEPRRYWTTDLEKRERELLIKRDMVPADQRKAIDQQLKDIQYEWYVDLDEEKPPPGKSGSERERERQFNKMLEKQLSK